MPNGHTHAIAGGVTGITVAAALSEEEDNLPTVIGGAAVGTFFGKLPDILEPSLRNPNHRQFFHSVLVLVTIGYGIKRVYDWKPETDAGKFVKLMALCAGLAYGGHLLLDSSTPKSLPLVGKL